MLKLLIISPIFGIVNISIITKIKNIFNTTYSISKFNRFQFKTNINTHHPAPIGAGCREIRWEKYLDNRVIGQISGIITYLISLYILLNYNSNNIEYQLRDKININWYQLNIGIDGISIILIILTTFIFPILFMLIPKTLFFDTLVFHLSGEKNRVEQNVYNSVEEKQSIEIKEFPTLLRTPCP